MGSPMARWKFELHLPFLVIGVEDLQIKFSKHRTPDLAGSPNSLPLPPNSTGRFLALRDGSAVAYRETIEGVVAELPSGTEAWIIVYPVQEAAYWPQCSVPTGQTQFRALAQFGRSETKDAGEKFILLLVTASHNASTLFQGFRAKNATKGCLTCLRTPRHSLGS